MAAKTRVLTDHEEIRRWAEERGARPARVRGTGGNGDVGIIRLDFPGYTGEDTLEPISWDEWFRKFDESNLALIVEDVTATGQKSNFNKLVGRETVEARAHGEKTSRRARKAVGQRAQASGKDGRRRSASAGRSRSARATGSRSRSTRSGASRGSRSRRSAGTRQASSRTRTSRSSSTRATTGKKRAQGARATSRSRSRRRAA